MPLHAETNASRMRKVATLDRAMWKTPDGPHVRRIRHALAQDQSANPTATPRATPRSRPRTPRDTPQGSPVSTRPPSTVGSPISPTEATRVAPIWVGQLPPPMTQSGAYPGSPRATSDTEQAVHTDIERDPENLGPQVRYAPAPAGRQSSNAACNPTGPLIVKPQLPGQASATTE